MRFLCVNHLRLGSTPGGIPGHVTTDTRAFSTRIAWYRAVDFAVRESVHAVLLSGDVFSPTNTSLEPWGPLVDGLADLKRANIPVIAVAHGEFTPHRLAQLAGPDAVYWLHNTLDWHPRFTTGRDLQDGPTVHVVPATLAESVETPASNPITIDLLDHPNSIWLLTNAQQPDTLAGEHTLVIEPGTVAPLTA